jgi:hypothetical protein
MFEKADGPLFIPYKYQQIRPTRHTFGPRELAFATHAIGTGKPKKASPFALRLDIPFVFVGSTGTMFGSKVNLAISNMPYLLFIYLYPVK